MSGQMNFGDLFSAISSPESASGRTRSGAPDGQTIDPSGPAPALANLSARQAEKEGKLTSGTYGRTGSGLSRTIDLQSLLASKLHQRTASGGSILYRLIWKARATPSGRRICALRASEWTGEAPRGGNGYSGPYGIAPIPWSPDGFVILPSGLIRALWSAASTSDNGSISLLSGYPTPRAEDGESAGARHSRGVADTLTAVANELAGWGTPTTSEPGGTPESSRERKLRQRAKGDWVFCRDGFWRPTEPGTSPLAHAVAARVGKLRAYGNGLDAETATGFVEVLIEILEGLPCPTAE